MKKFITVLGLVLLLGFACIHAQAQNVVRKGDTFESVSKKSEATKTKYTYKDRDGVSYPIYLSSKGKAFIIKKSKKTGKEYKQYLPKITEMLNEKGRV